MQIKIKRIWVVPIVIALLMIVLHYANVLKPIENLSLNILQPVERILYNFSKNILHPSNVEYIDINNDESTVKLKDQIQNLTIENAHLKTVLEESKILEKQISFLEDRSYKAVSARITSRSTENLSQTIFINRGSKHGIKNGYPVIIDNGIIIGVIHEVQDYSATILLLTSYNSLLNSSIQNDIQSIGVVKGSHNLSLLMNYIPQSDNIELKQVAITSGVDNNIPKGLLVGRIQKIINEPGSLFQQVFLQPFFNINEMSIVSIIIP